MLVSIPPPEHSWRRNARRQKVSAKKEAKRGVNIGLIRKICSTAAYFYKSVRVSSAQAHSFSLFSFNTCKLAIKMAMWKLEITRDFLEDFSRNHATLLPSAILRVSD